MQVNNRKYAFFFAGVQRTVNMEGTPVAPKDIKVLETVEDIQDRRSQVLGRFVIIQIYAFQPLRNRSMFDFIISKYEMRIDLSN